MVVEHTFITTMEAPEALTAASNFLQQAGFVAEPQSAFALDGGWRFIELRRGKPRARAWSDWPQTIRVEWDRGRVDVAASIQFVIQRRSFRLGGGDSSKPRSKVQVLMQQYLLNLASALELLLAEHRSEDARALLSHFQEKAKKTAEKTRRRDRMALIIVLVIVALLITGIIVTVRMVGR